MAAITMADITAVEKEVWVTDNLQKNFDEGTLLLDAVDKGDQEAPRFQAMGGSIHDGKYCVVPLHTGPNPNAGVGVGEGFEYPVEGGQAVATAKYRSKKVMTTRGISQEVINRVNGNPQAAVNWVAWDAARVMDNSRRRMDFYLHGDGSGMLTTLTSATNAGALTVADTGNMYVGTELALRHRSSGVNSAVFKGSIPANVNTATSVANNPQPYPWKVDVVVSSTVVNTSFYNGTAINNDLSAANSNYGVFLWDQQGEVPWGLDNICSRDNPANHGFNASNTVAGTITDQGGVMNRAFGAIERTANEYWQPATATNCASQPLSITDHVQVISTTLLNRDTSLRNSDDLIFLLPRNAWWQIVNDLETGKRTMVRTTITDGKYDAVKYDVFTFCYSFQQPANTGYVFAPKYVFRLITTPWQEDSMTGSNYRDVLGSVVSRPTGKFRAPLYTEQQVIANSCRAATKVTNIAS